MPSIRPRYPDEFQVLHEPVHWKASQYKGCGFYSNCGLLYEESLSPGTLASVHTSGHMSIRLVGKAELSCGLVRVSGDGCLSLCIGPEINWQLFSGCNPAFALR